MENKKEQGYAELKTLYIAGGVLKYLCHYGNNLADPQKIKDRITMTQQFHF